MFLTPVFVAEGLLHCLDVLCAGFFKTYLPTADKNIENIRCLKRLFKGILSWVNQLESPDATVAQNHSDVDGGVYWSRID